MWHSNKTILSNIICVEIYKASSQIRVQERDREREIAFWIHFSVRQKNLQVTCIMSNVATQEVISPDGIRASLSSESLHGFAPDASLEKRGSALQELSWFWLPRPPLTCCWDLITGTPESDVNCWLSIESKVSPILTKASSPSFLNVNAWDEYYIIKCN